MFQITYLRWLVVALAFGTVYSSSGQVLRNPYYNSKSGTAQLTDASLLKGRFYYHRDPLSKTVSFYFYSKGTSSQQIIAISRFRTLTISSRSDTTKHYTFQQRNGKLFLSSDIAGHQELTREFFTKL